MSNLDHRHLVSSNVVAMWQRRALLVREREPQLPGASRDAKAVSGPAPACVASGDERPSAVSAGRYGLGLLSLSLSRTVEQMADVIGMYHDAQAECEPLTDVRNDRVGVVHARSLL